MVINTKLTVNGTTISEAKDINVERNIGDFNAISNFTAEFDSPYGRNATKFSINDEVKIYADIDSPATTLIFTGIIETINFEGEGTQERLSISGRDYGAVLMDMTVQPIVFKERDAGEIAKVIIQSNSVGIVTTSNVDTSSGTTITKISFNHKNLFDALQELAKLSEYVWYVDENKDVHFEARSGVSSGETFDNTNVFAGDFKTDDKQIFNKVWVYGDRILTGATDVGGIGAGSVLKLTDKPHNTRVFVDSVLQEKGGILGVVDPSTDTGIKYAVDFQEKDIVFLSGTGVGDNIPASGTSNIQVDYERSTPILKFRQDVPSIINYGPKTKVIIDRNIKNFEEANEKATSFLAENKDIAIEGNLELKGIIDLTPGNTAIVNLPNFNISNQTYDILSVKYAFTKINCLDERVVRVTLNKKITDFVDTMKDQINRMRNVEAGPLEGTLTRLETAIDTVPVDSHWEVYGFNIGSNFVLHSAKHGLFHDSNSRIGKSDAGSTLFQSGGYLE